MDGITFSQTYERCAHVRTRALYLFTQHTHVHKKKKKKDLSELFKDVFHFPFVYIYIYIYIYIYLTCDRDFIKRAKIFSPLSLCASFLFLFFFFFRFLKNVDICSSASFSSLFFFLSLSVFFFSFSRMFQSNKCKYYAAFRKGSRAISPVFLHTLGIPDNDLFRTKDSR